VQTLRQARHSEPMVIKRKNAQASVDRWPEWIPSLAILHSGHRFLKRGVWYGPMGGRHVCYAFTRAGVQGRLITWVRHHATAPEGANPDCAIYSSTVTEV
jgi:hypothetical protein